MNAIVQGKTKPLAFILVFAMLLTSLAGCGGSSQDDDQNMAATEAFVRDNGWDIQNGSTARLDEKLSGYDSETLEKIAACSVISGLSMADTAQLADAPIYGWTFAHDNESLTIQVRVAALDGKAELGWLECVNAISTEDGEQTSEIRVILPANAALPQIVDALNAERKANLLTPLYPQFEGVELPQPGSSSNEDSKDLLPEKGEVGTDDPGNPDNMDESQQAEFNDTTMEQEQADGQADDGE